MARRVRHGVRIDAVRAALRGADRAPAVPHAVRLAPVADPRPAPARRPRGRPPRRDRHLALVPRRDGAAMSAIEAEIRETGARIAGQPARASRRTPRPRRCSRRPSGSGSATRTSRISRPCRSTAIRERPPRARPRAGLRDGRHLRRGVRGGDAVLLRDLRGRGLAAGGAASRAAGRARDRQRPGPDRAGDRVRLLRRQGRRDAPRRRAGRR